jgi:D-xylonolactonase
MKTLRAFAAYNAAAILGEGPVWDAANGLLKFVDIKGRAVHAYHPGSGAVRRYRFDDFVCWLVPHRDGGYLAGLRRGIARAWFGQSARMEPLDVALDLAPGVRLNDAKAHPDGSVWFGSMHDSEPQRAEGELFRLAPDLTVSVQDQGIHICNGPAFSADGRRMLHNDSLRGQTYSYEIQGGRAGAPTLWRSFGDGDGAPDGMCFDSEGGLWVACWGAGCVRRLLPDGSCDQLIELPVSQPSSVAFGGRDLRTLFITTASEGLHGSEPTAGALFAARVEIPGLPAAAFG